MRASRRGVKRDGSWAPGVRVVSAGPAASVRRTSQPGASRGRGVQGTTYQSPVVTYFDAIRNRSNMGEPRTASAWLAPRKGRPSVPEKAEVDQVYGACPNGSKLVTGTSSAPCRVVRSVPLREGAFHEVGRPQFTVAPPAGIDRSALGGSHHGGTLDPPLGVTVVDCAGGPYLALAPCRVYPWSPSEADGCVRHGRVGTSRNGGL